MAGAEYPKTVRTVLSGHAQISTTPAAINQGEIYKFITKPWKLEVEFKSAIRQAIEHYNSTCKTAEAGKPQE